MIRSIRHFFVFLAAYVHLCFSSRDRGRVEQVREREQVVCPNNQTVFLKNDPFKDFGPKFTKKIPKLFKENTVLFMMNATRSRDKYNKF